MDFQLMAVLSVSLKVLYSGECESKNGRSIFIGCFLSFGYNALSRPIDEST